MFRVFDPAKKKEQQLLRFRLHAVSLRQHLNIHDYRNKETQV